MQKIGTGYDVHKLAPNRKLTIGGITIPYTKDTEPWGLLAHSDGDVLVHAIMDAMLGAAGMGDIGEHFPDTDPAYKNINSLELLQKASILIEPYYIVNIDATLIAQEPKISPYKKEMEKTIAKTLNIPPEKINIKATTEEGLGFTGAMQGMAAQAICLLEKL